MLTGHGIVSDVGWWSLLHGKDRLIETKTAGSGVYLLGSPSAGRLMSKGGAEFSDLRRNGDVTAEHPLEGSFMSKDLDIFIRPIIDSDCLV